MMKWLKRLIARWLKIEYPIDMVLHCPECGTRHIDEGLFAVNDHHTHACQECGLPWRPAIVCTRGVRFLPGFKNGDIMSTADVIDIDARLSKEHKKNVHADGCIYILPGGGYVPHIDDDLCICRRNPPT